MDVTAQIFVSSPNHRHKNSKNLFPICLIGHFQYPFVSRVYCVCVKRITLCNWLFFFLFFFVSFIQNMGKFGAKNYFADHRIANTILGFRDSFPVLKIRENLTNCPFVSKRYKMTITVCLCNHFKQFSDVFMLYILTQIV